MGALEKLLSNQELSFLIQPCHLIGRPAFAPLRGCHLRGGTNLKKDVLLFMWNGFYRQFGSNIEEKWGIKAGFLIYFPFMSTHPCVWSRRAEWELIEV